MPSHLKNEYPFLSLRCSVPLYPFAWLSCFPPRLIPKSRLTLRLVDHRRSPLLPLTTSVHRHGSAVSCHTPHDSCGIRARNSLGRSMLYPSQTSFVVMPKFFPLLRCRLAAKPGPSVSTDFILMSLDGIPSWASMVPDFPPSSHPSGLFSDAELFIMLRYTRHSDRRLDAMLPGLNATCPTP